MPQNHELRNLIEEARNRGAFVTTTDKLGCPMSPGDECGVDIAFVQVTGPKGMSGAPLEPAAAATILRTWLRGAGAGEACHAV